MGANTGNIDNEVCPYCGEETGNPYGWCDCEAWQMYELAELKGDHDYHAKKEEDSM